MTAPTRDLSFDATNGAASLPLAATAARSPELSIAPRSVVDATPVAEESTLAADPVLYTYKRAPVELVKGEGVYLFDSTGKFLPDAELRKKFDAIGASAGTPLVSYCMVGMRASVTYFVARHLGYDARMYDGSIEDWTHKKLPAKTGR